jgi:hypothetical protein
MSARDQPATSAPADDVAAALDGAGFLGLVAAADGDALAAAGLLARARDGPFQVSVTDHVVPAGRATDADQTLAVGVPEADADLHLDGVATSAAFEAASRVGDADPVLALAGLVAAGERPAGAPLEAATLDREPGVAVPTDPADGLAHSTLVHAPFSGDVPAATALVERAEESDRGRTLASLVALSVAESGTPRASEAVERALHPYVGGPFETVGGYADVLDALAREAPGLGVAVALGHGDRDAALDAWRRHGERAHSTVRAATTARYDGLFVARVEAVGALGTAARLLGEFRSPEPVVLAVGDGTAAVYARPDGIDAARVARRAAGAVDGEAAAGGRSRTATARFEAAPTEFIAAAREAA